MTITRPDLKAGAMGFNRGRPVRLLHRVSVSAVGDVWRVEPIFVVGEPRDELFLPGEHFRPIHGC